jgi:hypothetical protein
MSTRGKTTSHFFWTQNKTQNELKEIQRRQLTVSLVLVTTYLVTLDVRSWKLESTIEFADGRR